MEKVTALPLENTPQAWNEALEALGKQANKALYIQLFKHFAPKVKAYILRLGLLEGSAEEVTQETMLALWNKAHLYDATKANASTWIFVLARNLTIDRMRKQKYPEYSLEQCELEPAKAEDSCEQSLDASRLKDIIGTLPDTQRQVIYMSFYEGRSHSEIAERLNLPLGSVKSRIRLASQKLKSLLRGTS